MPFKEVMHKWKHGKLHSGSKKGPVVRSQQQALAIAFSYKEGKKSGQDHLVCGRAAKPGGHIGFGR